MAEAAAGAAPVRPASLYVGDLPIDLPNPEDALYNIFSKVGIVVSVKVCRDIQTQRSLGYAYVNYQEPQHAEAAIDSLNYTEIRKGRPIRVMWSTRDPMVRKNPQANLFVKNLDKSIDTKALRDTFSVFGTIMSCKLALNPSGESLGYGFVHFEKPEAAAEAIERVNGIEIAGKVVEVCPFVKRADRDLEEAKVFTRLYMKNLVPDCEKKLGETLSKIGEHQDLFVSPPQREGSCFATVTMSTHEAAVKAIEELNGKSIEGLCLPEHQLYVSRHLRKSDRDAKKSAAAATSLYQNQGKNIYVKHIDDSVTKEQFEEMFAAFGKVTSAQLMKDEFGTPRGFGFVCYDSKESAQNAIREMNGKMMHHRPLFVCQAQQKDMRQHMLQEQRKNMFSTPAPPSVPMYPPQPMNMNMNMNMYGNRMMMPPGPPMMPYAGPMGRGNMGMRGGMPRGNMRPPFPGPMMHHQFAQPVAPQPQLPRYTQPPPAQQQQQPARPAGGIGLTARELSAMTKEEQKNILGERLYTQVQAVNPEQAAKITGMLLEMETTEILNVLEEHSLLVSKVNEAMTVLRRHQMQ